MLSRLLAVPVVAAVTIPALAGWIARRSLPQVSGEMRLFDLNDKVEIFRDRWGVPHIYAQDRQDAFFAQGFVHAQDRLWQMELQRRAATGRLSEIFGHRTLHVDRLFRRLGFHRSAQREIDQPASQAATDSLTAYVEGVNAAIRQTTVLPPEFLLLRHEPEPWTLIDSLSWGRLQGWRISSNWDSEILRYMLATRLDAGTLAQVEPQYPAGQPLAVPAGAASGPDDTDFELRLADLLPFSGGGGSNAWAVAGWRTESGKPILASDPHLGPQMPALWYEVHLEAPGLRVAGASLPGLPGVLIGHNDRIAWGITASFVDVQDLYAEQISSESPAFYRSGESWREGQVVREPIVVRGETDSWIEEFLVTHHGPIIGPPLGFDDPPIALSSTIEQITNSLESILELNRAGTWDEFRAALAKLEAPTLNFVYADEDGNIGYQLAGRVPIRGRGDGLLPAPGWDPRYDWQGFIPFERMPTCLNPATGCVVSANNKIVDDDYPFFLSHEWVAGYRAQRMSQLLGEAEGLNIDSSKAVQLDAYSIPGRELVELMGHLLDGSVVESPTWELMREWDCQVAVDSAGAAAYAVLRRELIREIYEPKLGGYLKYYLGAHVHELARAPSVQSRLTGAILDILGRPPGEWFGNGVDSWRPALLRALERSDRFLRNRLGPDHNSWEWGQLHTVSFNHPLGESSLLGGVLNRGPFPMGGDFDTVSQSPPDFENDFSASIWLASYRQIFDLSNFDLGRSIQATGQSGHPLSSHYFDQGRLWLRDDYHPTPFSRMAVLGQAQDLLTLLPSE